ncbi:uncharacterized protein VP01_3220g2, partial [Puccinia sorghi]
QSLISVTKFYLADAGYGLNRGLLVPYQGTDYHLCEQHCRKNLLNCLKLTCRNTQEASVVLQPFSKMNVPKQLHMKTEDLWFAAWLEHAAFQAAVGIMLDHHYKLEHKYDCVIACACIHKINILWNDHLDQIFQQSWANLGKQPVQKKINNVHPLQKLKNKVL